MGGVGVFCRRKEGKKERIERKRVQFVRVALSAGLAAKKLGISWERSLQVAVSGMSQSGGKKAKRKSVKCGKAVRVRRYRRLHGTTDGSGRQ